MLPVFLCLRYEASSSNTTLQPSSMSLDTLTNGLFTAATWKIYCAHVPFGVKNFNLLAFVWNASSARGHVM